ncbi:truncated hemoglobin YjbI [Thermonema lapsum]|uniref:Truncated hemoglobin YjbI n=1 Tax=Thermonema lapsum TaxID=28195 RepID=A0A846MTE5_9BACT|nr:hypothetical protein [Thermonema lapsum]NIK74725.1 truncated hemoglobin YjbI [Thermonema lapsum]
MKIDIQSQQDVKEMVNHFYAQVRVDALPGGIFNGVSRAHGADVLEQNKDLLTKYRFHNFVAKKS